MPQFNINTPLEFIGLLMLASGVFLFLTGFGILKIEKVTVKPGRPTWIIGVFFSILGAILVFTTEQAPVSPPPVSTATNTPTVVETPTVTSTATFIPTLVNMPVDTTSELLSDALAWPIIVQEPFDNNDAGWSIINEQDEFAKHNQAVKDGKFIWGLEAKSDNVWYWKDSPFYSYSDFLLSVKCRNIVIPGNDITIGLLFRKQGNKFYTFRVDESQYFAVQLYNDGDWTDLIGWTKISKINTNQFNQLTVIAQGSEMVFFINNSYVGTVTDDTLSYGNVSLTIGSNDVDAETAFEFDDFEIREKP